MTTPTEPATPVEPAAAAVQAVFSGRAPRRGFAFGLWSMILGLISPVWFAFAILFTLRAGSMQQYPDQEPLWPASLNGLVIAFDIFGFIVGPLGSIAALVLGIVALVRNRTPGRIMGGIGLLGLLAAIVGVIALVAWFLDALSKVSG